MSYVSRNPAGAINGLFRNRQHDASEELEDDHPEIEAYKAGLHRPPVDFLREINDEIAYIMTWSPSNEPALPQPDPQDTSVPIPEDLNTPLVPFAEENGHGTGHGQETGEGGGEDSAAIITVEEVDAGEDAQEDDPFDAEFEESSDEDGEPIPDALALMAPEGMPFDDLKEYFRQKQQALHHRLIDGGQSLPPLSFEEHEELNTLQKYIGWFN